jgi:hypothetical protein
MNIDSYMVHSYINFIFNSNKRDPVQLEEKDRRFNFGDWQPDPLGLARSHITAELPGELPYFFDYIMRRSADQDMAASIMKNATRANVVIANQTSVDMLTNAIANGDLGFLWEALPDLKLSAELHGAGSAFATAYSELVRREAKRLLTEGKVVANLRKYESRLTRDELHVIFEFCIGGMPQTPNKFSRMLKHHNIELKRVRIDDILRTGIEIEWIVSQQWLKEHETELNQTAKLKIIK